MFLPIIVFIGDPGTWKKTLNVSGCTTKIRLARNYDCPELKAEYINYLSKDPLCIAGWCAMRKPTCVHNKLILFSIYSHRSRRAKSNGRIYKDMAINKEIMFTTFSLNKNVSVIFSPYLLFVSIITLRFRSLKVSTIFLF